MELGIALPTMQNGWVISHSSPKWSPTWDLVKGAATKAEHYGMDFALATVQLNGMEGPTKHFHDTLDSFATISALAAVTERLKLYGSIATLTTAPALVAKQAATISDISNGRFGLNIVSGLEKGAYEQIGVWPGDHHFETRYDHASEYMTIIRELWETGHSNFKGKYFEMNDAHLGPLPPHPVEVVCAGQSDRGTQFCAEHGDLQLAVGKVDVDEMKQHNKRLQDLAGKAGRDGELEMIALYSVVVRDTDEEAEEVVADWRENQDYETVAKLAGREYGEADAEATKNIFFGTDTFMINFPRLVGSPDTVAEQLRALGSVEGVRGMILAFQDYEVDIDRFGSQVLPKVRA